MQTWRRTTHRHWLIGLVMGALVLIQALGQAHAVRHGLALGGLAVASAPADEDVAAFGHESGGVECSLYDQLAHADLALPAVVAHALPALTAVMPAPASCAALATGRWRAQARGPPQA